MSELVIITLKEFFKNRNGFYIEANAPTLAREIRINDKVFYATQNCIITEEEVETVKSVK